MLPVSGSRHAPRLDMPTKLRTTAPTGRHVQPRRPAAPTAVADDSQRLMFVLDQQWICTCSSIASGGSSIR